MLGKFSCVATLVMLLPVAAHAWDVERGEELSETCAACHGPTGMSPAPTFPHIAGQYKEYIYQALVDYKLGKREDPIMAGSVAELDRQDMRDVAAYYASQEGLELKR